MDSVCAILTWPVCRRTDCCYLLPFQGSVGIYTTSSLTWCIFSALLLISWGAAVSVCWLSMLPLLLIEMLLPSLPLGLWSNPSAAGNPPIGQQTSGTAESYEQFCRFLFLWLLQWLTLPKWYPDDGVSLPFRWRVPWWLWITCFPVFCEFQMAFQYFPCENSASHYWGTEHWKKPPVLRTPGFLYLRVKLEELVHHFTLTSKSGRQKVDICLQMVLCSGTQQSKAVISVPWRFDLCKEFVP